MKTITFTLFLAATTLTAALGKQCFCPAINYPVCGSNGKTYPNPCEFNCLAGNEGVKIVKLGECREDVVPCICGKMYVPVCGSDGQTYDSRCVFECEQRKNRGLAIVYEDKCKDKPQKLEERLQPSEQECACPLSYEPLCGTDNTTYSNQCTFNCVAKTKDVKLSYKGECRNTTKLEARCKECKDTPTTGRRCVCPLSHEPLCGTDGKTYANQCLLNCANIKLDYKGECLEPCACPDVYFPVCGSNGKTYPNMCELQCVARETKTLKPLRNGVCEACACPDNYNPLCGSDGLTYSNQCELQCEANKGKQLKMEYLGECGSKKACPGVLAPVCASNGVTFDNKCFFERATETDDNLRIRYAGECKRLCVCPPNYDPICATDGGTYANLCELQCAGREVRYRGGC